MSVSSSVRSTDDNAENKLILISQEDFNLVKNEFGDVFEKDKLWNFPILDQLSSNNMKDDLLSYLSNNPDDIANVFYEIILCYRDTSRLTRAQSADLIKLIFNMDPKLSRRRKIEFLTLFNGFEVNTIMNNLLDALSFDNNFLATYLFPEVLEKLKRTKTSNFIQYFRSATLKKIKFENYQLLHEESLGYAIFSVEMYNAFKDDYAEFKVDYYQNVLLNLIAYYKLDAYKCLDILFEVFSNNFVKNWKFAIDLLKKSLYWPIVDHEVDYVGKTLEESLHDINSGGNERAAQIIAVKLAKYPENKPYPETLKLLLAVLVKEGFINFGHFYNILKPIEEDSIEMNNIFTNYKSEMQEKSSRVGASELAMAAPLEDSDDEGANVASKRRAESAKKVTKNLDEYKEDTEEPLKFNFKVQMLRTFLSVGLYTESVFILSQFPYVPLVDEVTSELINRLMSGIVDKYYDQNVNFLSQTEIEVFKTSKLVATTKSSELTNQVTLKELPVSHLITFDARMKSYATKNFKYFYEYWDNLPVINEPIDLIRISKEFLKFNDVLISRKPSLVAKICDIIHLDLIRHGEDEQVKNEWFEYFRHFIFPCLSLIECNPSVINKAFSILKLYPEDMRYNLYGEYQSGLIYKNNLEIKLAKNTIQKKSKDALKRLSIQNAKSLSRKLAKLASGNPMIVLTTLLEHIESYDNLIDMVVDLARFFNDFTWDVLPFAILTRLTNGRDAVQGDGLNNKQWIQSLASFIGKIYSKHSELNIKPILTLLIKKFNDGDIDYLIIIKELLISSSGIQQISNLTLEQIELLNGENSLRKVVFNTIQDKRGHSSKSATRLLNDLIEIDGLNELFILLTDLHNNNILQIESHHIKILGLRNDDLESILHVFTELVNEFLKYDEFVAKMIPIDELCSKLIQPKWTFELWRKRLSQMIRKNSLNATDFEGDIKIQDTEQIWNHELIKVMDKITVTLPDFDWKHLNVGFYVTFWQLSLYDINYHDEMYDNKKLELEALKNGYQEKLRVSLRSRDIPTSEIDRLKTEVFQLERILESLPGDKLKHADHSKSIMERIEREKNHWFETNNNGETSGEQLFEIQIREFLQRCLLPRATHSPLDAIFCAKFLFFLHRINTKGFITMLTLNQLFQDILDITIMTSSNNEAENLGLFYEEILRELNRWRNKEIYESEAVGLEKIEDGSQCYKLSCMILPGKQEPTDYSTFSRILFNFHRAILRNIHMALKYSNYLSRANALIFLKNCLGIFPIIEDHCESVLSAIQKVIKEDEREDLKLSSNSLIGRIKSYSKEWVHMWDFYEMTPEERQKQEEKIAHLNKLKEEKEKLAAAARQQQQAQWKEMSSRSATNRAPYRNNATPKQPPLAPSRATRTPTGPRSSDDLFSDKRQESGGKNSLSNEPPSSSRADSVNSSSSMRDLLKARIEEEKNFSKSSTPSSPRVTVEKGSPQSSASSSLPPENAPLAPRAAIDQQNARPRRVFNDVLASNDNKKNDSSKISSEAAQEASEDEKIRSRRSRLSVDAQAESPEAAPAGGKRTASRSRSGSRKRKQEVPSNGDNQKASNQLPTKPQEASPTLPPLPPPPAPPPSRKREALPSQEAIAGSASRFPQPRKFSASSGSNHRPSGPRSTYSDHSYSSHSRGGGYNSRNNRRGGKR